MSVFRQILHAIAVAGLLCGVASTAAMAQQGDPVEQLKNLLQELPKPGFLDTPDKVEAIFAERNQRIKVELDKLTTLAQMTRAFEIQEWLDNDFASKLYLLDRMKSKLDSASALERQAVATWIGSYSKVLEQLRTKIIPLETKKSGDVFSSSVLFTYSQQVAPILTQLLRDPNAEVRLAALRSVGQLFPPLLTGPDGAHQRTDMANVLTQILQPSAQGEEQRFAVLNSYLSILEKMKSIWENVGKTPAQVNYIGDASIFMLDTARIGLQRNQSRAVRRLSGLVIERSADILAQMAAQPAIANVRRKEYIDSINALLASPELKAAIQGRYPGESTKDPQLQIDTMQTLESLAVVREATIAAKGPQPPQQPDPHFDLLGASAKQVAAELISDGLDTRTRLAALSFLEILTDAKMVNKIGTDIFPALKPQLAYPNPFVRWASSRTLARVGKTAIEVVSKQQQFNTDQAKQLRRQIVEELGDLLLDRDIDVRKAAAESIEELALAAKKVGQSELMAYFHLITPKLIQGASFGDADARTAVLQAFKAVGIEPLMVDRAVPVLLALLQSRGESYDEELRQNTAELLGSFGPLVYREDVVRALQATLSDESSAVRNAAANALLSILPAQQPKN